MADSVDDWLIRANAANFPRRVCPIKQIDRGAGKEKAPEECLSIVHELF
jgi:hypothetical protein